MPHPQPINVLYLIDYWASPGGTERHLAYLLGSLDRARFKCHVAVFNYQPNALAEQARAQGIEIVHIPVARYYTLNALLQARKLARFIRARNIQLVQTFHYKSDVYGALVARLAGVKHIVSSKRDAADYKSEFRFFMHRLVRPITERYVAVSEVVADVVRRKERVRPELISVIYNGVDLDKYSVTDNIAKAQAKQALGFSADDYVVGMSAWFRPEKDHQLLIDAYRAIRQEIPNARLALVGGGPLFEHFRTWTDANGLSGQVKLVGAVDDVRPYLRSFDVACLVPKINEGFSNSILEKMATGLPVVVTDVGGNKEAVAPGDNGFVIAPGDLRQLTEHLRALHRDAALRERMGSVSRARVEQLFSLQAMIRHHADLYTSLVARTGGKTP